MRSRPTTRHGRGFEPETLWNMVEELRTPRREFGSGDHRSGSGLWYQPLYVDPVTRLLCRTDRLPEEKARRRAKQHQPPEAAMRMELAPDWELRLINGFWHEVHLAPMPVAAFRAGMETWTRPLRQALDSAV